MTDTFYRQYEVCCGCLCDSLVSSTICFALCLKGTVKIHFMSCYEFRKTKLCRRNRKLGTRSLDIWHVAKNLVKKIAKVVLLVIYCSFLLCLRYFVISNLDNNKYNTE